MTKFIKNFSQDKKGNFSIVFVIVAFIGIIIVTACLDILKQSYVINEVQSIMDTSGVSALHSGIDIELLRGEDFVFDEDSVLETYEMLVYDSLNANEGGTIVDSTIESAEVELDKDSTWGLGVTGKGRDQAILSSVVTVQVKSSVLFDVVPQVAKTFYDSKSETDFTVTVNGETEDGYTELIIRSVSRIVYR